MDKITVIGGGSWGTTLAHVLIENNQSVVLYDISLETIQDINTLHMNPTKLGKNKLSEKLYATNNLDDAISDTDLIVIAIPTAFIRTTLKAINKLLKKPVMFCNVSKGLELVTHKRVSEIVNEEIDHAYIKSYTILSGPSHAEEVIEKKITSIVAASKNTYAALLIQSIFSNDYLRVYTSKDVLGVELSGSLKNIYAIASGILDGLGNGINTKAFLITRSALEMKRMISALGGKASTVNGLCGVGDLIVTCTSTLSRNYSFGYLLGQGTSFAKAQDDIKMVVEGIKTCKSAYNLSKELNIETPIIDSIYRILYEESQAVTELTNIMKRQLKKEEDYQEMID